MQKCVNESKYFSEVVRKLFYSLDSYSLKFYYHHYGELNMIHFLRLSDSKVNVLILRKYMQEQPLNQFNPYDRAISMDSSDEYQKMGIVVAYQNPPTPMARMQVTLKRGNIPQKVIYTSKQPVPCINSKVEFAEWIVFDYIFEETQQLRIRFWDGNGEFIGEAKTFASEIFTDIRKSTKKGIIRKQVQYGHAIIRAEMTVEQTVEVMFQVVCQDIIAISKPILPIFQFCCGSNPSHVSWRLYKIRNNQQLLLAQSQRLSYDENGNSFKPIRIGRYRLCNNKYEQPIFIKFVQNDKKQVGLLKLDFDTLSKNDHKKHMLQGNKNNGWVSFMDFRQNSQANFFQYLYNGMQMALVACIDFTASNLLPNDPNSLHYNSNQNPSPYLKAIREVSKILLSYDYDKLVPLYGFGARVKMPNYNSEGKIDHCFPLNGNMEGPNVSELAGIEQAYRKSLQYLQFSGPTYFAPLLRMAIKQSQRMKKEQKEYMILMVLTDGIIHDKDQVIDLLVSCSRLPISIIIVGIGNGEPSFVEGKTIYGWDFMQQLNNDDLSLKDSKGHKAERDLVSFVPFEKFNNDGVELAREVLRQIPSHVKDYHRICGIKLEAYRPHINLDVQSQIYSGFIKKKMER